MYRQTVEKWIVFSDHQVHAESVICPDGEHQCADGQTCCRSREGYSCCPLANVGYLLFRLSFTSDLDIQYIA